MEPIDATVGRQLFVDDHLLASRTLERRWSKGIPDASNPILYPQTASDLNGGRCPVAAPFDDGIEHDVRTGQWRVWYMSGWFDRTQSRTSPDGLDWMSSAVEDLDGLDYERDGDVLQRDGVSVCVDHTGPERSYALFRYVRQRPQREDVPHHDAPTHVEGGALWRSTDGVSWTRATETGPCGDNTSFFYDPFRDEWTFSVRTSLEGVGRLRGRHASSDLLEAARWEEGEVQPWIGSHGLGDGATVGDLSTPEIYKVTCMAYESLMLGVFAVYRGPSNAWAAKHGVPKTIDLYLGASRNGYHYSLSPEPFLTSSGEPGAWDFGYLHMVNGGMLPVGDETRIYYTAFSGTSPSLGSHMYAGGAMGVARMRRDGFARLVPPAAGVGFAVTKVLNVLGEHLFVNAVTGDGEVALQIEDVDSGERRSLRIGSGVNSTAFAHLLPEWPTERSVRVRLSIALSGEAELYSFWFGRADGDSGGYTASGPTPAATTSRTQARRARVLARPTTTPDR